jgi:hypothetical protein
VTSGSGHTRGSRLVTCMATEIEVVNRVNGALVPGGDDLKCAIATFARNASVELSIGEAGSLAALAAYVPRGTLLHVADSPGSTPDDLVQVAIAVREAGYTPCPHVVTRRIASDLEMRRLLDGLRSSTARRPKKKRSRSYRYTPAQAHGASV